MSFQISNVIMSTFAYKLFYETVRQLYFQHLKILELEFLLFAGYEETLKLFYQTLWEMYNLACGATRWFTLTAPKGKLFLKLVMNVTSLINYSKLETSYKIHVLH